MRWALDPEQLMFQDALVDWLGDVASPPAVRSMSESGDPSEFETRLAEEGWLAIGIPEESGGQGGGLLELAIAAEQFARRGAPTSAWLATVLALPALDPTAIGSAIEEGVFAAIVVNADRPIDAAPVAGETISARGAAVLNGTVAAVLGADRASLLVVPVDGQLFLVRADAPGVTITPRPLLDQSRSTATVAFEAVEAAGLQQPAAEFLGQAALRGAVLVAADSLGAASEMLALSVQYSTQRTQFGAAIGSFQAVKHTAATMLVAEEASRSIVYYAAASVDEGLPERELHAATAKAQATRAGSECAESALTMHGAIGYTWEHDLQLLYKRAKLDVALFGAPGVWNERIARALDLVPATMG